ncbi:hypothetical protein [Embleya sp. AB8]|uniref:hypothetical protein n=1 Tax=Embleya sp. AB8 TaxID=3156304 RepID=UPI003C723C7E
MWARYPDGTIKQFAGRIKPDGTVDVTALGDTTTATTIATGYTPAAYPLLSTDGNITGDTRPDLWTRTSDGSILVHPGQDPANGGAFAPPILLALAPTPPASFTDLSDGTLVQATGAAQVSVVQGGARFPIPDEATFNRLGYAWDRIKTLSPTTIDAITRFPRDGTLLREENDPNVYLVRGGIRHAFTSEARFNALGYQWTAIRIVPDHTLDPTPRGTNL